MNAEIATLQTKFSQDVLKEKNASGVLVNDRAELAGMPENEIAAAASAAKEEKKEGKFLHRSSEHEWAAGAVIAPESSAAGTHHESFACAKQPRRPL